MALKKSDFTWNVFLLTSKSKTFKGAIQRYKTVVGEIPVCFSTTSAYVFEEDDIIFDTESMKSNMINASSDVSFPESCSDLYLEIVNIFDDCSEVTINRLGLSDLDLSDIEERLNYINSNYGDCDED